MEEKIENVETEVTENTDNLEEKEQKVEEAPVEAAPQEEKPNENLIKIGKPNEDEEAYDAVIEKERASLYGDYNKSRKYSNIITVAVLVVALAGMILAFQENMILTIIGWALIGVTIIGMLVYYFVNRNKFPNKTREYIKTITRLINEQNFKNEAFNEVVTDPTEKFDISSIIGDGVYSEVASAQSRNIVRGKYNEKEFMYAEVALFKKAATKKDGPMFVGKYISVPNKLEMRNRIVINIKNGEKAVDLPNAVSDLTKVVETPTLDVYGLKETKPELVVGKKFYESFVNEFALKDSLVNVNLVVWAGRTAIYLSYDDAAMGLPFDKPFNKEAYEQMFNNVDKFFELNEKIGK